MPPVKGKELREVLADLAESRVRADEALKRLLSKEKESVASATEKQTDQDIHGTNMTPWDLAHLALKTGDNVLLMGPKGLGKSYLVHQYGNQINKKVYTHNFTETMESIELYGHYLPNERGSMTWMYGPGIMAMKTGGIFLGNELHRASQDVQSAMHFFADGKDVAHVTLPKEDHETVTPNPAYQVVCTMNGLAEDIGEALADRFHCKIWVETPNPEAVELLDPDLKAVGATKRGLTSNVPSLRSLMAFQNYRKSHGAVAAARLVFGTAWKDFLATIRMA